METLDGSRPSPLYAKIKSWGFKPLVLDFYVQRVWSTFSLERILAKVIDVRPASAVATTIRLRPNFNFRNFQAGQHVLVTASVNGHCLTRTYSPTLMRDGSLEITVKDIAGGKLSTYLARGLKRGATVEISEPFGEMTWPRLPVSENYVFCAGGVGITPLRSLIHAWDQAPNSASIELHYWAKTEAELCFRHELEQIAKRQPRLKLYFYVSAQKTSVESIIPSELAVVLACGPQGFVQSAEQKAKSNKLRFVGEYAAPSAALAPASNETFYDLTYGGQVIRASSQRTILESLEAHGLTPAQGCRMGLCKSCTCMKVSGATFSSRNQVLNDEANEEIQICVASPRSPIQLEKY